jgi:hypothetical protein
MKLFLWGILSVVPRNEVRQEIGEVYPICICTATVYFSRSFTNLPSDLAKVSFILEVIDSNIDFGTDWPA